MDAPITCGTHHIGLTVSSLEASARFFTDTLGWQEVRRDPDYPAVFVSDGHILVTLWQVSPVKAHVPFDKNRHVGLHHGCRGRGLAGGLPARARRPGRADRVRPRAAAQRAGATHDVP